MKYIDIPALILVIGSLLQPIYVTPSYRVWLIFLRPRLKADFAQ